MLAFDALPVISYFITTDLILLTKPVSSQQDRRPKMLLTSRETPVQSHISKRNISALNNHGGQNKNARSTSIDVVLVSLMFTLNIFHTTFNISQVLLRLTFSKYLTKSGCCAQPFFFVNFGIYLFKFGNENSAKMCEICSKLTIKTQEGCQ